MAKRCNNLRGFSLIELMIVMGLLMAIAGITLTTNTENYNRYSFRDERDTLILSLQKVRSEAMNTMCLGPSCTTGLSWGIHRENNSYTIFQGAKYNPIDVTNEIIFLNLQLHSSGLVDIVFTQLSGNAIANPSYIRDIVLVDSSGRVSTTTISGEGQITWTN